MKEKRVESRESFDCNYKVENISNCQFESSLQEFFLQINVVNYNLVEIKASVSRFAFTNCNLRVARNFISLVTQFVQVNCFLLISTFFFD